MSIEQTGIVQESPAARERLLEAALHLFTTRGYAATTVREIVEAAGVSKPVLYYYFKNKEGIYLELMDGTHAIFQGLISQLTTAPGSAHQRIIRFATGIFDAFVEHIEVVRLIYAIFFGPPQGAPYFPHEQYFDSMLDVVADMVQKGIDAGELKPVEIRSVTWAIISCMNTVMEEQLCNIPPRVDREGLVKMIDLVIDGIAVGGKP